MFRSDNAQYGLRYAAGVALCLFAGAVALHLPDLDQRLFLVPLVVHRSAVFHSALLPLLFLQAVIAAGRTHPEGPIYSHPHANPVPRLVGIGVGAALAAHFCFDLLPRYWYGFALVHFPVYGRLSPALSFAWLAGSALVCLWAVCCLLRRRFDLGLAIACAGASYGYLAYREPTKAVYALLALSACAAIAFLLPRFGFGKMPDGLAATINEFRL